MTAERVRPWWASDGPVDGGVDRRVDPLELHRAARRGEATDTPGWAGPEASPATEPLAGRPDDTPDPDPCDDGAAPPHGLDTCGVCPVCSALRALQETRPELAEHLAEAARHLAAAARSLLEPPTPPGPSSPPPSDGLRRIHLDDHVDVGDSGEGTRDPQDPTRTTS